MAEAQQLFDVIITTDTNIEYQNKLAGFDLAMIVLRGYTNSGWELAALMPQVNEVLNDIESGQIFHFYMDEKWMKNCGRWINVGAKPQ